MKTVKLLLPSTALATFLFLGAVAGAAAQSIFGEGSPPATATVAWNAERLTLRSPPAVQGLDNHVTLKFSGGGNVRYTSRCGKSYHIANLNRMMQPSTHGVRLNGSTVSMPIDICGPHAVGKTFRISWVGRARVPSDTRGTTASGQRITNATGFGDRRTSFAAASNCPQTHVITHGQGFNKRTRWGSVICWTDVTITN